MNEVKDQRLSTQIRKWTTLCLDRVDALKGELKPAKPVPGKKPSPSVNNKKNEDPLAKLSELDNLLSFTSLKDNNKNLNPTTSSSKLRSGQPSPSVPRKANGVDKSKSNNAVISSAADSGNMPVSKGNLSPEEIKVLIHTMMIMVYFGML